MSLHALHQKYSTTFSCTYAVLCCTLPLRTFWSQNLSLAINRIFDAHVKVWREEPKYIVLARFCNIILCAPSGYHGEITTRRSLKTSKMYSKKQYGVTTPPNYSSLFPWPCTETYFLSRGPTGVSSPAICCPVHNITYTSEAPWLTKGSFRRFTLKNQHA